MNRLSRRIQAIGASPTVSISDRARRMRAQGRDVISFSLGEPDFPTPAHVVEAAAAACRDPRNHHYTANPGLPELREAIAADTLVHSGLTVSPKQVLVTNGGKQAVYLAMSAMLDPGDEVLIPSPYWVTYPEAVRLAGGVPVEVPWSDGFLLDLEHLERAATPRTKLLVFVSPSNPTGTVHTESQIRELGGWAGERGIWVLTDEIYQRLVYDDARFVSMPAVAPELEDRWLVVNGVAKTYAMTGWRVGWLIGPSDVVTAADNHQSHLCSNVSNVSQRAALAALTGPTEPIEAMRTAFDGRRRLMLKMLSSIPSVHTTEPKGAFYVFPDFRRFLDRFTSTIELAEWALETAEVATVPGEAFGAPGYLRLSYALSEEDLAKGINRLRSALAE
jgi:aspartate/methionine/tyrosine aminotransferase